MITSNRPLVYQHPLSHLVDSLPYVDGEPTVHKTQQQSITKDPLEYIKDLKLPNTPFIDSQQFKDHIERINNSPKKTQQTYPINDIIPKSSPQQIKKIIQTTQKATSYNILKTVDLQLFKKLGPSLLRQQISTLQQAKKRVQQLITKENEEIIQLNARRKYQQLQNFQKIQTIKDRIRILINKQSSSAQIPQPQKKAKLQQS